jgi:thioredoxin
MKRIKDRADFQALLDAGKPILLDFYADWCGPCQRMLPTIEKLAEKHADHFSIAKVNVEEYSDLAQEYGIRSIPALFFLQDGEVQESLVGLQTEAALEARIEKYTVAA